MRKVTTVLWYFFLNRKTVLGPTYGSPVKKMLILPSSKDDSPNSRYMAYVTQDKVKKIIRKWFLTTRFVIVVMALLVFV